MTRTKTLIRDCHSVPATALVARNTSTVLVSCRFAPGGDFGVAAGGLREAQAVSTFCSSVG